jgi:hypothetical protein
MCLANGYHKNDTTRRNVNTAADCSQLRQIAPSSHFRQTPEETKLTVSANNTISCSQNRFTHLKTLLVPSFINN